MLTNLIMRGVIKGEEWVAGHFISAHISLPCGTVLFQPDTHTHARLHTHTSFTCHRQTGSHNYSLSKLSTANLANVSTLTLLEEKWMHLLHNLFPWHSIPISVQS